MREGRKERKERKERKKEYGSGEVSRVLRERMKKGKKKRGI